MSVFLRLCYLSCNKLVRILKNKAIEVGLIIFIFISFLLPLRCPTGRGYNYLNLDEIFEDIETCVFSKRPQQKTKPCPVVSSNLGNFQHVRKEINTTLLDTLDKTLSIQPGGSWFSPYCTSPQRVALIVPYRNREFHLKVFLQHMHPFLQSQLLDYTIFVVEQNEKQKFNRGKLFNIGFKEALKLSDFCCFIFHDVDLLPESPQHIYECSKQPRHMCSALDTFRYVLPYPGLFGGVVSFTKAQFELVNGYSNVYYGWGGEDDDLCDRLLEKQLSIRRWAPEISRYTMLFHKRAAPNPVRANLLESGKERFTSDGLNSLEYKLLDIQLKPLYTWFLVDL